MITKLLDKILKEDILRLISNGVSESRTMEYKSQLPGNSDDDKKEFLKDISALANSSGGDIVFGISDNKGIAHSILGLRDFDPDQDVLRLQNMARDGIEPRMDVQFRVVGGFDEGFVIVVRVPKSWNSPHMVVLKGWSKFFTRRGTESYPMDVTELRNAFVLSESLPERITQFRKGRIEKIMATDTPVPTRQTPALVLHMIPLATYTTGLLLPLESIESLVQYWQPMDCPGSSYRINIDGLLTYHSDENAKNLDTTYCQIYRTGQLESVCFTAVRLRDGFFKIFSTMTENWVLKACHAHLKAFKELEVACPITISITVCGTRGARVEVHDSVPRSGPPIDRDTLELPQVLLENYADNLETALRPAFDALWNAGGSVQSGNYDKTGKRIQR